MRATIMLKNQLTSALAELEDRLEEEDATRAVLEEMVMGGGPGVRGDEEKLERAEQLYLELERERDDALHLRQLFESHKPIWEFYRAICVKLEEVFVGIKAIGSGRSPKGEGKEFLGEVLTWIPSVQYAGKIGEEIGSGGDQLRMNNMARSVQSLATVLDMKRVAEQVARYLSIRYANQLAQLRSRGQEASALVDGDEAGSFVTHKYTSLRTSEKKDEYLKLQVLGPAQCLADYVVALMFEGMQEGPKTINPGNDLALELVRCVGQGKSKQEKILGKDGQSSWLFLKKVTKKIGRQTVVTNHGDPWCIGDVFLRCGVRGRDGTCLVSGDGKMDPFNYGYCFGMDEELGSLSPSDTFPVFDEHITFPSYQEKMGGARPSPAAGSNLESSLNARFDRLMASSDEESDDDGWVQAPEAGSTFEKLDTSHQKIATILPATKKRGSTIIFNEIDALLNDDEGDDGVLESLESENYGDTMDMMVANMRCMTCNAKLDANSMHAVCLECSGAGFEVSGRSRSRTDSDPLKDEEQMYDLSLSEDFEVPTDMSPPKSSAPVPKGRKNLPQTVGPAASKRMVNPPRRPSLGTVTRQPSSNSLDSAPVGKARPVPPRRQGSGSGASALNRSGGRLQAANRSSSATARSAPAKPAPIRGSGGPPSRNRRNTDEDSEPKVRTGSKPLPVQPPARRMTMAMDPEGFKAWTKVREDKVEEILENIPTTLEGFDEAEATILGLKQEMKTEGRRLFDECCANDNDPDVRTELKWVVKGAMDLMSSATKTLLAEREDLLLQ